MFVFFGEKAIAFMDVWSIEHVVAGMSIGSLISAFHIKYNKVEYNGALKNKTLLRLDLVTILFISFLWETIEIYLEMGLLGSNVKLWLHGIEHWSNRIISDPLMVVIGYFITRNLTFLTYPARIFSLTWLYVHIFIFPHSMYLHEVMQ